MSSKWRHGSEGLGSAPIKRKHEKFSGQSIYWMLGWDSKHRSDEFQEIGCIQGHYLIHSEGSSNEAGFKVGCDIVCMCFESCSKHSGTFEQGTWNRSWKINGTPSFFLSPYRLTFEKRGVSFKYTQTCICAALWILHSKISFGQS